MYRGTGKHPVAPGSVVNIITDAEFTVYAINKAGVRSSIIGPNHSTERRFRTLVPPGIKQIEITTRKSGRWLVTETPKTTHKEKPDPTPVSMGVREEYDPQADMVREITESVMSKIAEKAGHETFEEANDFDIEDEYDPTSQYELSEMQEEYEPCPPAPIKEEASSTPAPTASGETSEAQVPGPESTPAPAPAAAPPSK